MSVDDIIERFWDAVDVGDENTVSDLAYDMPIEELKRALHRCNALVRKTRSAPCYVSNRDTIAKALKEKS